MKIFHEAAKWEDERRAFVYAVVVSTQGSSPRKAGARMLIDANQTTCGTVGGGTAEQQVAELAAQLLMTRGNPKVLEIDLRDEATAVCGGSMTIYLEPHHAPEHVAVFGAGHVAEELCPLLIQLGFDVSVCDSRDRRLSLPSFSQCKSRLGGFEEIAASFGNDRNLFHIIMTPDHRYDYCVLRTLIEKDWCYLGLMASTRKKSQFVRRLLEEGIRQEQIDRIAMPIGISIGSQTPAEIAVSISAQLIEKRSQKK